MSESIFCPAAYFIQPPAGHASFGRGLRNYDNEAVNLAKCSYIKRVLVKKSVKGCKGTELRYPGIYFVGCGVAWGFNSNKDRDAVLNTLFTNYWLGDVKETDEARLALTMRLRFVLNESERRLKELRDADPSKKRRQHGE